MAVKLEHLGLVQHQASIMKQLRDLWHDGRFCDLALRSRHGIEHRAHAAVLSVTSKFFKTLLSGSFLESEQVQQGPAVEIAASVAAVAALLDYVCGGQPAVSVEDSSELLRIADACGLSKLAESTEKGLRASLNIAPVATH
ncbi:unnamed protein product [Effrenium voratum]|nr:unnamed protein product [Effrenium voratum]